MPRPSPTTALLLLVGIAFAADHVAWAWACTWPMVRGDGTRHALVAVEAAQRHAASFSLLELRTLYRTNYYPAGLAWLSLPVLSALGASSHVFRAFLGVFSGLLAVGTGALAWRLSGPRGALAGALLTGLVPLLWTLRADIMLDVPLAAWVAVFLALLPVGSAPRWRAVLCGLALVAGMLSKQTMPYLALPALAVVGARLAWAAGGTLPRRAALLTLVGAAGLVPVGLYVSGLAWPAVVVGALVVVALWGLARQRLSGALRAQAENLAVIALVAVVLAGPWYAVSVEPILTGLEMARRDHADVPRGLAGLVRILGMSEYLLFFFVPAPALVLALAGGGLSLPRLRGDADGDRLLLPVLASLLAGGVLISRFPDLHGRHYAPLLPMVLALAALPVGALARRGPRGRGAATVLLLVFAVWNGVFALSWRTDLAIGGRLTVDRRDADIPPNLPAPQLRGLPPRLLRVPTLVRFGAPRPDARYLPMEEAMARIVADRDASFANQPAGILADDPEVEDPGLHLAVVEANAKGVRPLFPPSVELVTSHREKGPVYLIDLRNEGRGGRPHRAALRPEWQQLGFSELARLPARVGHRPNGVSLVVYRLAPD